MSTRRDVPVAPFAMLRQPSYARTYRNSLGVLLFVAVALKSLPCLAQSLAFNETTPQFGAVVSGKSSKPKILSISNISHAPVLVQGITATEEFAETNNCNIWLSEGSACLIFVTFTPQAVGQRAGKLTVSLVGLSEQAISLNGVGLAQQGARNETSPGQIPAPIRTTNNEEKAQTSVNNKKSYSFQDLLNKNPEGVADAKELFALTDDTVMKQRMASILLSIGVKDQAYYEYLTNEAEKALAHDHDMPRPVLYDEQGLKTALNPALNEWCKTHGVGFWDMEKVEYYEIPVAWYYLAAAGDARTYDLLLKGLHSQNVMIATWAAKGLAKLQDPRAIDELISTGRHAPAEAGIAIAQSLIYFADPKAQAAAEELMPEPDKKKNMVEVFRSEMKKNGLRALFDW